MPLRALAVVAMLCGVEAALGQSTSRAVFVSNNGNLEGSVSAFTVNPNGTLAFVNRVVTGSRASISDPCAGCNGYELSLTPNGRYLAVAHPAGDVDGISILQVASNAAVSLVMLYTMPLNQDAPLDVQWLDNEYFAVASAAGSPNNIRVYRFNPAGPSVTPIGATSIGSSGLGYLCKHPTLPVLYANNSTNDLVLAYTIGAGGSLSFLDSEPTGAVFPLDINVSPNGQFLYGGCGISGGGNKIVGMTIDGTGALTGMAGTPFTSPTTSTFNTWVSDDNAYLIVGHSTSGQVHTFGVDGGTGVPTATGNFFDVGIQGEGQDVRTLDNLLFVVDNFNGPTGVYSFTIGAGGTLTQNGVLTSTGGIAPRSLATWKVNLPGDLNCSFTLDLDDIGPFVLALLDPPEYAVQYPGCNINLADVNGDTFTDGRDAAAFTELLVP
ncbi:MAG: beta-propeller fold lactonase family protein [Planctomycetes bacterium]|nr:beta-propeller fold lactonase family protein [Planctomycetota bacterium]